MTIGDVDCEMALRRETVHPAIELNQNLQKKIKIYKLCTWGILITGN